MLTPTQRSLRSRLGAHVTLSKYDAREITAAARAAGPGQVGYWEDKVDPGRSLPELERARRAEHAKKAHYTRMALASAKARRKAG